MGRLESCGGLGAVLGRPKTTTGYKKSEKGVPSGDLFGTFASFGHLGVHLEAPGGKKSVPKAPEGDLVDIVKT